MSVNISFDTNSPRELVSNFRCARASSRPLLRRSSTQTGKSPASPAYTSVSSLLESPKAHRDALRDVATSTGESGLSAESLVNRSQRPPFAGVFLRPPLFLEKPESNVPDWQLPLNASLPYRRSGNTWEAPLRGSPKQDLPASGFVASKAVLFAGSPLRQVVPSQVPASFLPTALVCP